MHAFVDCFGDGRCLFDEVVSAGIPQLVDALTKFSEAEVTAARGFWEVGAGKEWSTVGQTEHRHRPTAVTVHRLHGVHIHSIDIGAFFAIDFDVHEKAIHERAGGFVFK